MVQLFSHGSQGLNLLIRDAALRGPGVIILTGPSSCGKGAIAKGLCDLLSIPASRSISMGEILRGCFERTETDTAYAAYLDHVGLGKSQPVLAGPDGSPELEMKMERNSDALSQIVSARTGQPVSPTLWRETTPMEWLKFCTTGGMLVPNRWTQLLVEAQIANTRDLRAYPLLIDGYPRTETAADHLLGLLSRLSLPIISVLHLSISRQQMLSRAGKRGRLDDEEEALRKRYQFYIDSVQPSVDFLKDNLPAGTVSLIDAHQPSYIGSGSEKVLDLGRSIDNVLTSCLLNLGLPETMIRALIGARDAGAKA